MSPQYPFQLPPLPYAYEALEPYIDTLTMQLHHDRHLKTYVDNLNAALASAPKYQRWTLTQLLLHEDSLPSSMKTPVHRSAGGVFNHEFFFKGMTPGGRAPNEALAKAIMGTFGSFADFYTQFKAAALAVFGSGYAWLVANNSGRLEIITTSDQDTPLPLGALPLSCIDVWEHAYYLKHYNLRPDYVDAWFRVADFGRAGELFSNRA